tara:strand:- start:2097 stop:2342 length:246 start_codon:yes stop_codon:yes gene_type:complete
MKEVNSNKYVVNGLLKGTSANVVNIPHKLIKELKWKIHDPIEIRINDCLNMENKEWQEITITRQEDVKIIYEEINNEIHER